MIKMKFLHKKKKLKMKLKNFKKIYKNHKILFHKLSLIIIRSKYQ